jgi:glycosyltransferase involved in cell wall biosynthesis
MKLSVILPCYNGADTIAVQLEALTRQQWEGEWEVVIVNNGSTDNSMQIVETYRDRLPNLRIVEAHLPGEPHLGVAHSYNVGIATATGDAFAFCEADDQVMLGWVAAMADALAHHEFVAGALEYTRLNEAWILPAHGQGAQSQELIKVQHPPYLAFAYGCNLGLRRSMYEKIGPLDESIRCAWDMDYCFRAQLAGIPLQFMPHLVVHYRVRDSWDAIYRQSCNWGRDNVLIRRRYQVGIGRLELPRRLLKVMQLYLQRPRPRPKDAAFAQWLFSFGWEVGEVQGLVDYVFSFFRAEFRGNIAHRQPKRLHW